MRRILLSPHYADGEFCNLIPRPVLSDGSSFARCAHPLSHGKKKINSVPPRPLPFHKTDFSSLSPPTETPWSGWDTPASIFSSAESAFSSIRCSAITPRRCRSAPGPFPGTNVITAQDIPPIDCLLISHDHWDHLDYPTVTALKKKTKMVVCGLGTGAHFRRWGFDEHVVHEADWGDSVTLDKKVVITLVTASHYSGRSLTRNKTLWTGFFLESAESRVFFSGDSGYGPHFADTGRKLGAPDIALLDCGQYNDRWKYIHMTPEQAVQAALDMGAKALLPAHAGKFSLAFHSWDDPFRRAAAASSGKNLSLATPVMGDAVFLERPLPSFPRWWEQTA